MDNVCYVEHVFNVCRTKYLWSYPSWVTYWTWSTRFSLIKIVKTSNQKNITLYSSHLQNSTFRLSLMADADFFPQINTFVPLHPGSPGSPRGPSFPGIPWITDITKLDFMLQLTLRLIPTNFPYRIARSSIESRGSHFSLI